MLPDATFREYLNMGMQVRLDVAPRENRSPWGIPKIPSKPYKSVFRLSNWFSTGSIYFWRVAIQSGFLILYIVVDFHKFWFS